MTARSVRPLQSIREANRRLRGFSCLRPTALAVSALCAGDVFAAEQLQLEVFLNGAPTQLIGAFSSSDGEHLSIEPKELEELGVKVLKPVQAETLIQLNDLDGLTYRYDVPTQRLFITAQEALLAPKTYDVAPVPEKPREPQAGYGAVLNYNLFAASNAFHSDGFGLSGVSTTLDARAFSPFGVLSQSMILRSSGTTWTSKPSQLDALRLDTAFTYSDSQRLVTYRAGDTISGGLAWTRSIRIGGMQAQRSFALRPDLVTIPLASAGGSAAVPSAVDVYVNNIKTYSQNVGAGPYQITNIPVITGGNEARVVLSDAAGHEVQTTLPFYVSPTLLAPGLVNFSVESGLPRTGFGTSSDAYLKAPVGSASVRRGMSDWLTLENHAEIGAGTANAGMGAVVRAGGLGVASFALAASRTRSAHGFQPYGSLETRIGFVTLNASSQATIGSYDDLAAATSRIGTSGLVRRRTMFEVLRYDIPLAGSSSYPLPSSAPPKLLGRISAGAPLPLDQGAVSMSYLQLSSAEGNRSRIVTASYSRALPFGGNFNANAFVDFGTKKSAGVLFGLSFALEGSVTASTTSSRTRGQGTSVVGDVTKPLGGAPGDVGWRVTGSAGQTAAQGAAASYRSSYGWGEVTAARAGGNTGATAQFDGSVATLGTDVFMASRIEDGFAVVDAGAPAVEVSLENRPVGVTDKNGKLLVPGLRSYQTNKISIDTRNLPVDAEIDMTQSDITPADRSGVPINFGVHTDTNAAVLILTSADGKPLPPGLQGGVAGSSRPFAVGYDGRVYVQGLAHQNSISVETAQGRCEAAFEYSARPGEQVIIPLVCR